MQINNLSTGSTIYSTNKNSNNINNILKKTPGYTKTLDNHLEFAQASATPITDSTGMNIENAEVNGQTIRFLRGTIYRENGRINPGTLAENTRIGRQTYRANTWISFHDNGQVSCGTLAYNTTINGQTYHINTQIEFYRNGQVKQGTLAHETIINGITFPADSQIQFDERGNLLPRIELERERRELEMIEAIPRIRI